MILILNRSEALKRYMFFAAALRLFVRHFHRQHFADAVGRIDFLGTIWNFPKDRKHSVAPALLCSESPSAYSLRKPSWKGAGLLLPRARRAPLHLRREAHFGMRTIVVRSWVLTD